MLMLLGRRLDLASAPKSELQFAIALNAEVQDETSSNEVDRVLHTRRSGSSRDSNAYATMNKFIKEARCWTHQATMKID